MKYVRLLFTLLIFSALAACGGGGGGDSGSNPEPTTTDKEPVVSMAANGHWIGTYVHDAVQYDVALVMQDGTITGASAAGNYAVTGSYVLSVEGKLSASVSLWRLGEFLLEDGTLVADVSPQTEMVGTWTQAGESDSISFTYDPAYEQAVSLADLEGVWQMSNASLSVDSAGTFFYQDDTACAAQGQFLPTGYNAVQVDALFSDCGDAFDGEHNGLAVLGGDQLLVTTERWDRFSMFMLLASRTGTFSTSAIPGFVNYGQASR